MGLIYLSVTLLRLDLEECIENSCNDSFDSGDKAGRGCGTV
jgi:hypothetical protein